MTKLIFFFFFIFFLNLNSVVFGQEQVDDDANDFGEPNKANLLNENDDCALSKDSELIKLSLIHI